MQRQVRNAIDRYFVLLVAIIVTVATLATVEPQGLGTVLLVAVQAATALLAVSTSDSPRRTKLLVTVLSVVSLGIVLLATVIPVAGLETLAYYGLTVVLVAVVPVTITRRLLAHKRVSIQTVMGAICIYLIVGLFFAVVAGACQHLTGTFFASGHSSNAPDFIYWSYITLATVGYGDLVPGSDLARMIAVFEALIGQIYLVTVVALLVSSLTRDRPASFGDE